MLLRASQTKPEYVVVDYRRCFELIYYSPQGVQGVGDNCLTAVSVVTDSVTVPPPPPPPAADTCSLYRVQHITHSHVVTANMRGQIKAWDLRAEREQPTSSVMASQQQVSPESPQGHSRLGQPTVFVD